MKADSPSSLAELRPFLLGGPRNIWVGAASSSRGPPVKPKSHVLSVMVSSNNTLIRRARARDKGGKASSPPPAAETPAALKPSTRPAPSWSRGGLSRLWTSPATGSLAAWSRATGRRLSQAVSTAASWRQKSDAPEASAGLEALRCEIVEIVKTNMKAKESIMSQLGEKAELPFLKLLPAVLREMNPGVPEGQIVLRDVRDSSTGAIILPWCRLQREQLLGSTLTSVVFAATVLGEEEAAALGVRELAVKVIFGELLGRRRLHMQSLKAAFMEMLKRELAPSLRTAGKPREASALAGESRGRWTLPKLRGSMGASSVHEKGGYGVFSTVLLSDVMLGDGGALVQGSSFGVRVARPSLKARELFAYQMLAAVALLHGAGLVHMDLKPENYFVGPDGNAYLADFGFCGLQGEQRHCAMIATNAFVDPSFALCSLSNGVTTLSEKYDSWSLGVASYSVLTGGALPFGIAFNGGVLKLLGALSTKAESREDRDRLQQEVREGLRAAGVSQEMVEIVSGLLDLEASTRLTPAAVIQLFPTWPSKAAVNSEMEPKP